VQQLNTDLFSGPALSLDEYRYICLGNPFYFVTNSLHSCGFAEKDIHRRQTEGGSGFGSMNQSNFPIWGIKAKNAIRFR